MFDAWGTGEWTFIIFFLIQFGAVVWMLATMHQQVKDIEKRTQAIEDHNIGSELATIRSELTHIREWIDKQA